MNVDRSSCQAYLGFAFCLAQLSFPSASWRVSQGQYCRAALFVEPKANKDRWMGEQAELVGPQHTACRTAE